MKNKIKIFIYLCFNYFFKISVKILSSFQSGHLILDNFIEKGLERSIKIKHKDVELILSIPNALTKLRAKTFSTKEPQTLDWIDGFENNSVFWDIGGNIGLYSLYAAKKKNKTYCFEPSFINLEFLARNINLNNLNNDILVLPIALNDKNKMSNFKLTSSMWGSANSTFDKNYTADGSKISERMIYQTVGFTMNDIAEILKLPYPDYVKIDVDGIEHLILKGGNKLLKNVKSVLVENSNKFFKQAEGIKYTLEEAGLKLSHEIKIDNNFTNQIWTR